MPLLMRFLAADSAARLGGGSVATPVSPSEAPAAVNSLRLRAAVQAVAEVGLVRETAGGRDHRHRAVDWLNSPPSPRLHARQSPVSNESAKILERLQQNGLEKAKRQTNRRPKRAPPGGISK